MISRKVAEIRNSLVSINNLPMEIIVQIATFFVKERDLINATAFCQHWRSILISSPRLWCNAGGSSSEIQAYIKRSGLMPIVVNLSSPKLAKLIVPHTSRLVGLVVRANDSQCCLDQIAEHLCHPIPSLQTFCISTAIPGLREVKFTSDIRGAFFLHSKKLELDGICSFRGSLTDPDTLKTFPHVTELTVRAYAVQTTTFMETLDQLPNLERVSITFTGSSWYGRPQAITLPNVQEMSVLAHELDMPILPILKFIKLPNIASLHLKIPLPTSGYSEAILPTTSFGERFPSLADLPDLQATVEKASIEVTFRNPQAVFTYVATDGFRTYHKDRVVLGALPLHSVRRLIVDIRDPQEDIGHTWFGELLRDLVGLEHIEFRGECSVVVRRLCYGIGRDGLHNFTKNLVICAAGVYWARGVRL